MRSSIAFILGPQNPRYARAANQRRWRAGPPRSAARSALGVGKLITERDDARDLPAVVASPVAGFARARWLWLFRAGRAGRSVVGLGGGRRAGHVSLPVSYCGCCPADRCRAVNRDGHAGVRGGGAGLRRCWPLGGG